MARARDENRRLTNEALEYTREIHDVIGGMLALGERMGFNNEDVFYLILQEVNEQQLLNLLK